MPAHGSPGEPCGHQPELAVLEARELAHERSYLDDLRSRGITVVDAGGNSVPDPAARTLDAMLRRQTRMSAAYPVPTRASQPRRLTPRSASVSVLQEAEFASLGR